MLYLIKGRAGSGKTDYVNKIIKSVSASSGSKVLLIIPEQFSFESERKMLGYLGAQKYNEIDIFSFPRLAFSILKDKFTFSNFPSSGVRLALMHEALFALEGRINIFNKSRLTVNSLSPLVDFCRELKYCSVKSEELVSKIQLLPDGFLKEKLNEINLINEAYDALVKQSYFDDTESVEIMNNAVLENRYFEKRTVFIDGFRSFTKQESDAFGIMLSQADDVYVTLCTDEKIIKSSSFSFVDKFEKKLRTIASQHSVQVKEIYCQQNENAFSTDIFTLEKALFNDGFSDICPSSGDVKIVECISSDDECDYISKEIKRLLRSGEYRCRDIAVIERTAGTYKNRIADKLRKLDIPVFDDSRRSLKYESLFVYIDSVLDCITSGFTAENVFAYLKSGLSDISVEDISRLEKYVLIWNISGNQWSDDFTMHPDGFGNELKEADIARLEALNKLRKKAVVPLLMLKKECKDKTGKEISSLIYDFIVARGVSDRLYDLYSELNENGFSVEAGRQSVSWDVLMQLLDTMAKLYSDRVISLSSWVEKFKLLVDSGDVGEIPQGLDEVKIGSADRIRTDKLKVVFLVGVNKDEFPLVSVRSGVLTDFDRISLAEIGLELNPPFEEAIDEERFIAYCAVTAASQKLYLVYKTLNDDGSPAFESEIITAAVKSISDIDIIRTKALPVINEIECEENAFSLLAKNYSSDNSLKATLLKYFSDNKNYIDRLKALDRAVGKKHFSFEDTSVSRRLFKDNIYLSASRIESYYTCPFSYFIRYGLKAEPIRAAELDSLQSGLLVHYVMENVLSRYPKASFVDADEEEMKKFISELLNKYLDEKMGSVSNKSKRFMYLFNRLVDVCLTIIYRLKQEFRVGSFEPHDFELKIGGEEIPPYTLELEDGSIVVTGSVDRVDLMEKDGIKYIRVIDYKTGKKEFRLSELFSGINIQMVLYLMALEKNGKEYFGDFIPAGVLYLPSKIGLEDYMSQRKPSGDDVASLKRKSGKLSGMILNSPVVYNGMGVDVYPDYFPVGYNKNGDLTGNNFTQRDFKALSSVVNDKICQMGDALHKGIISAIPTGKDGKAKPCVYCSYKAICNYENGDEINEVFSVSHAKALEFLGGDDIGE